MNHAPRNLAAAALCLWLIACALFGAWSAYAQNYVGGNGSGNYYGGIQGGVYSYATGTVGSAPSPPSCTNSLDFSQACNSQYLAMAIVY